MKITTITPWPPSCDYPIFRKKLSLLKKHVNQVIVGLTDQKHRVDLLPWLGKNLKTELVSMPPSIGRGDWRNVITHRMIKEARNEWVLSLEQDFLIRDYDEFFDRVKMAARVNDVVTFPEGNRFHPAFLLCRKKHLKKLDFSVMGDGQDHFAYATRQLKNLNYVYLDGIGLQEGKDWKHLAGLTCNYTADKPYYRMEEFCAYNRACLDVEMSEIWEKEVKRCQKYCQNSNQLSGFL